ncbi:MAG: hypothetical protein P1U40_01150 [Coxiellaceae bacterium]|nr:hypothetical protein [Coxiellaceae bacterium]
MKRSDIEIELPQTVQSPENNRMTTVTPETIQRLRDSQTLFADCEVSRESHEHPLWQYHEAARNERLRAASAPLGIISATNGGIFDPKITRARAETACAAIDNKHNNARSSSPVPMTDKIYFK